MGQSGAVFSPSKSERSRKSTYSFINKQGTCHCTLRTFSTPSIYPADDIYKGRYSRHLRFKQSLLSRYRIYSICILRVKDYRSTQQAKSIIYKQYQNLLCTFSLVPLSPLFVTLVKRVGLGSVKNKLGRPSLSLHLWPRTPYPLSTPSLKHNKVDSQMSAGLCP